jgi:ribosome biogenesis GTPase
LRDGGFLADTPGLRQLALWDVSADELDRMFPEFAPYLAQCRFTNCAHISDEGCAVRQAVEDGAVDERRYLSYVKLFEGT